MLQTFTRRSALALGAGAALARPAAAQQDRFPDRPVRLIVPWPPGGSTDGQMRAMAEIASRHLGQPIVIDNRPGVSGTLGALVVKDAKPDGYTLAQMPISVFRLPQMTDRPNFDPLNDFTYVIHVTGYTFGVVVRADRPWRSWQDFVAHAKANPGKVTYGTPGVGSSLHITMEQIAERLGLQWTHVPFRGGAENQQATLSGTIDATADSTGWAPLVEAGPIPPAGRRWSRRGGCACSSPGGRSAPSASRRCRRCARSGSTSCQPRPTASPAPRAWTLAW